MLTWFMKWQRVKWNQDHSALLFLNTSLSEKAFCRAKSQWSKEHSSRHSPNSRTKLPFPESSANGTLGICSSGDTSWGAGPWLHDPNHIQGPHFPTCSLFFLACASLQESILPRNIHDRFVKQLMDDNQRPFQTRELEGKKQQRLMKWMKTTFCSLSSVNTTSHKRLDRNFADTQGIFNSIQTATTKIPNCGNQSLPKISKLEWAPQKVSLWSGRGDGFIETTNNGGGASGKAMTWTKEV